jgi:hypothetical protein
MRTADQNEETYTILPEIIRNLPFEPSSNSLTPRYLLIAISGGAGHIAAIKAFADKYQTNCQTRYNPIPYKKKASSLAGFSIFVASYASYFPRIQNILHTLKLPALPNHEKLMEAVTQLASAAPRAYIDMLLDVHPSGYESAAIWNIFQREDQKEELSKLVALQAQNDALFYHHVYNYFFDLLLKAEIENVPYTEIISTQVAGLPALCDAVRNYNQAYGKNIIIHQYMTDLPTIGAEHFFGAFSRLTPDQQQLMNVYAVGITEEVWALFFKSQFFNGIFNINPKNNPMIRHGFIDPQNDNSQRFDSPIMLLASPDSINLFAFQDETLMRSTATSITIPAHTKIASIMLGSQAGTDTVRYITNLIYNGIEKVFIFGGSNLEISKRIENLLKFSKTLADKVILLGNQDAPFICSLKTRSNVIIMRSGGLSVMEEMAVNHNPNQIILLHYADSGSGALVSGIPWEDHNADMLIETLKDQIKILKVMPSDVTQELHNLLNEHSASVDTREITQILENQWQLI